jgi:hypothetical protein
MIEGVRLKYIYMYICVCVFNIYIYTYIYFYIIEKQLKCVDLSSPSAPGLRQQLSWCHHREASVWPGSWYFPTLDAMDAMGELMAK